MLKKIYRPTLKDTPVSFINPKIGKMILPEKEVVYLQLNNTGIVPLADILTACNVTRLFLVCELDDIHRNWFEDASKTSWLMISGNFEHRAYTFSNGKTKVDVRLLKHGYFPSITSDVDMAYEAYTNLNYVFKYKTGMPLLLSPSTTGLYYLQQTLPKGMEVPTLEDDIEAIIREHTPIARNEYFVHAGTTFIDNFFYNDRRWAYANGSNRDVPVGKAVRDNVNEYVPFHPCWYHVTTTVPSHWQHIGLVPVKQPNSVPVWLWPNTPNTTFTTWLAEPEMRLLHDSKELSGIQWQYTIHERIMFDKARALRNWRDNLVTLWSMVGNTFADEILAKHVRKGIQEILYQLIGRLYSSEWKREQEVPIEEWKQTMSKFPIESRLSAIRSEDGTKMIVPLNAKKDKTEEIDMLPHIASHIWSYCRMMLARTMLGLPYDTLLGCNVDAIYTSINPMLPDKGTPGYFRLKGCIHNRKLKAFSDTLTYSENMDRLRLYKKVSEMHIEDCVQHGNVD